MNRYKMHIIPTFAIGERVRPLRKWRPWYHPYLVEWKTKMRGTVIGFKSNAVIVMWDGYQEKNPNGNVWKPQFLEKAYE